MNQLVKEFLKSVHIATFIIKHQVASFFETHCIIACIKPAHKHQREKQFQCHQETDFTHNVSATQWSTFISERFSYIDMTNTAGVGVMNLFTFVSFSNSIKWNNRTILL